VSKQERYGTCSDEEGNWGIEDDGNVILSGLVSHDACDAVMDILDERDALKAEVERLTLLQAETLSERNKAEAQVEQLQNRCDFLEGRGL